MRYSYLFLAAILATGLALVGCEGSGSDDGDTIEVTVTNPPAASDPDADFARITPSGLSGDKFSIAGRGTVFTFRCSPIAGAVSYTFTSDLGSSDTVAAPEVGVNVAGPVPAQATFTVYATNADGINTRSASKTIP